MLIIEGPDGGGKTQLATEMSVQLGWPVAERVVAADTTISGGRSSLRQWVDENLRVGYQQKIFDRHRLISEPIYGPIIRNELQDGFDDANWVAGSWSRLNRIQPFIIFCLPPLDVVLDNCSRDSDNSRFSTKQIHQIYHQYWMIAARMNAVRYDYSAQSNRFYPTSRLVDLVARHTRKVERGLPVLAR
jgi:hypothetical protein